MFPVSVPVLSCAFHAERSAANGWAADVEIAPAFRGRGTLGPTLRLRAPPAQAQTACPFPAEARTARALEPILVPKLRIGFADFPYLHCSIGQRLLTLETCCGLGTAWSKDYTASLAFSRANADAPDDA